MDFPRVEQAIETLRQHLDVTATRNTEIEAVLVGYLLTLTYSDYEKAVRQLVSLRGARHADAPLAAFTTHAAERLIRSIGISDIAGVLKVFGVPCKDKFSATVNGTPAHTAYDNIINNRHDVVHRLGANITLDEFVGYFRVSQPVFLAIEDALAGT